MPTPQEWCEEHAHVSAPLKVCALILIIGGGILVVSKGQNRTFTFYILTPWHKEGGFLMGTKMML
jgi:hypothetical protein